MKTLKIEIVEITRSQHFQGIAFGLLNVFVIFLMWSIFDMHIKMFLLLTNQH